MADPTLEQLQSRLALPKLTSSPFDAVVYRSSSPKYATESDLLTGEGSRRMGGRWNPIGIAVVYASLTPETAMAETLAHNRYYGIPIEDAMPRTFVAIDVKLAHVLDFRNGIVRQRLQVSETKLLYVDWREEVRASRVPITQRLGKAAFASGLEGLIVPSAADAQQHNLLWFPGHLGSKSVVKVMNLNKLSKL